MSNIENTNNNGQIIPISVGDAVSEAFFSYADYVIKDRALPDVRDGLKPIHRRIIVSANDLGLMPDKPYRKSAKIIGHVLGSYHPHGDAAAYGGMVTMAQEFTTRYPFISGDGNYGSIDGDPAAAYRYTLAKLSPLGGETLKDLSKNVVNMKPNFDNTEKEPEVLPSFIPALLANGSQGIAVGMATSIPPHNLTELYDACLYLIDKATSEEEVTIDELMTIVKAPDFPTKGVIVDTKYLADAYKTGKGKITLRGKYEVRTEGKETIIYITELPYQVNKAKLIEKIDTLAKADKIEGIKEVSDESAGDDIEIAIYLKKTADARLIINKLLKLTDLQTSISMNIMALVGGQPMQLNLKDCLDYFLAHCMEVITRRTQFDLDKINARALLVDGMQKALEDTDRTLDIIKAARSPREGIDAFIEEYELEEIQAKYIWDMKANAISGFNMEKLEEEFNELLEKQTECLSILNDQSVMLSVLHKELSDLKEKYGDERLTEIDATANTNISEEDLVEDEDLVVTITSEGNIKSVAEKEYNTQKRGGKGAKAASTKDDEIIIELFTMNSKDDLLFITNKGRCHTIKAYKIPKTNKQAKGKSINNYISLEEDEFIVSMIATKITDEASIIFVTKKGMIKRLPVTHLSSKFSVTKVIGINEGDELQKALIAKEGEEVIITTMKGASIRIAINEEQLRPMGRTAKGVKGIKLKAEDQVIDLAIADDSKYLLCLSESGLGKATAMTEWKAQKRGGSGIKAYKVTTKTGMLVSAITISEEDELFIGTTEGQIIRLSASAIAKSNRDTTGSKTISLSDGDKVFTASIAPQSQEEEEEMLTEE